MCPPARGFLLPVPSGGLPFEGLAGDLVTFVMIRSAEGALPTHLPKVDSTYGIWNMCGADAMDGCERASETLKALTHPVRLQIFELMAQEGEACVCHLEARLDQRQAYFS